MTQEATKTPTLAELRAKWEAERATLSFDESRKLIEQIATQERAEAKAAAEAERARKQAAFDAAMVNIVPVNDAINKAVVSAIAKLRDAIKQAGINEVNVRVTALDTDSPTSATVSKGPGVPAAPTATRAKSDATSNGAGKSRNVFTAPDGTDYTTRSLLETFGAEHYGDKALEPVGLSHRADALAEKLGFSKSKRES